MSAPTVAVRERPILFSGAMVRGILDDRKTQTRRVVKPQPWTHPGGKYEPSDPFVHADGITWCWMNGAVSYTENDVRCPYGQPGDRLWVREAWQDWCPIWNGYWCGCGSKEMQAATHRPAYRATPDERGEPKRWKPSIHMPRWASRLTLELTDVRVQRVQDISEADALDEGCAETDRDCPEMDGELGGGFRIAGWHEWISARGNFALLWDSLNGKRGYGWDVNPWVWVLSFRRVES